MKHSYPNQTIEGFLPFKMYVFQLLVLFLNVVDLQNCFILLISVKSTLCCRVPYIYSCTLEHVKIAGENPLFEFFCAAAKELLF
jgi:hypothetical protein